MPEPPPTRTGKKVAVVGSRPGGPRLRGPAQQGRPHGDRLRARRPHRRPAHVRHPQHEARQVDRRAPRRADGRRGRSASSPAPRSASTSPPRRLLKRLRRRRPLRRRHQAARPAGRGPRASRASTSPWSSSHANTKQPARLRAEGRQVHLRQGQGRHRHRRRRHRHRLRRHLHPPRRAAAWCSSRSCPGRPTSAPPTTPGRSGPRSTSSTTARRRPPALWGADPRASTCISTKRFVGDAEGRVKELHTVKVEWVKGPDGRFGPQEVAGHREGVPGRPRPAGARLRRAGEGGAPQPSSA